MSWNSFRGRYQNRFVSASGASSSSTPKVPSAQSDRDRLLTSGPSMNNVPPPVQLTMSNAPGLSAMGAYAKELEKKKEQEYHSLVFTKSRTGEPKERRKRIYEDEYLEKDDHNEEPSLYDMRRAAEKELEREETGKVESDEEDDPLDAFMAGVEKQASADKQVSLQKEKARASGVEEKEDDKDKKKLGRTDLDEEDMQESMMKYLVEHKEKQAEEEELYEYDQDGNIIWTWKKHIDPLPPLDHSTVTYAPFHKNFYKEHEDIVKMNGFEVMKLRDKMALKVGGMNVPKPVCSFAHFKFDKPLMDSIRKSEYEHPTPIQAQAIPAALSGRDVLGIAKTGSGKTAAYLWPAIVHIMEQPDLKEGDGPIVLVVVPTRELAIQVYQEAKRFCKVYNINVICAYGGGSKWEQQNELQGEGAEIVVCTPGRIIDLVKLNATNFTRVTFLVFDEADRMFDLGFEPQVMSIANHVRPDRQCLMFSATFKNKVEKLAREALCDPVRIVQGQVGEANEDVQQIVQVLPTQDAKWNWLNSRLVEFGTVGKVLIFVTRKANAEELATKLKSRDFKLVLLHGDMLQHERNEHLQSFRKNCNVMVATDVAARGLDIPEIRTVINYDMARDIDTHVHRIGRTGRAGHKGTAYTLVTEMDKELAGHLVRNLESVNQEVPKPLLDIALKAAWFKSERQTAITGGGQNPKLRTGLGFQPKSRPGVAIGGKERDPLKAHIPSAKPSFGSGSESAGHGASTGASSYSAATSSPSAPQQQQQGPASMATSSRLSALRNSFKSSFGHTFHKATSEESSLPQQSVSDPRPEWKRKIDEINEKIRSGQMAAPQQNSSEAAAAKKSRWA